MKKSPEYPLYEHEDFQVKSFTQKPLTEVNIESIKNDSLNPEDLRISAEALMAQSMIARNAGFSPLAENLERAAELTSVPNELLLEFYEALRPKRSTLQELEELANNLENEYGATRCAAFVRECAAVYKGRRLLNI